MKRPWYTATVLGVLAALLAGCGPLGRLAGPTPTPTAALASYAAQVQGLQMEVKQAQPVQVTAVVRVMFSETCAWVGRTNVERTGDTFKLTIYATTYADRGCAPATEPVEARVPLDVRGLPPGDYTVTAGDVSAVFTLK